MPASPQRTILSAWTRLMTYTVATSWLQTSVSGLSTAEDPYSMTPVEVSASQALDKAVTLYQSASR